MLLYLNVPLKSLKTCNPSGYLRLISFVFYSLKLFRRQEVTSSCEHLIFILPSCEDKARKSVKFIKGKTYDIQFLQI